MYKIFLRGKAKKQIDRLTPSYFKRVQQEIDSLAANPRPPGALKLTNRNEYRLRVGVYRMLYEIDDVEQVVTIYRVQHRRDVYR